MIKKTFITIKKETIVLEGAMEFPKEMSSIPVYVDRPYLSGAFTFLALKNHCCLFSNILVQHSP
jgi:hypothetical protein